MRLVCVGIFVWLSASAARGADNPARFDLERFRPALDGRGVLDVEAATVGEPFEMDASLWGIYSHDPLAVYRSGSGQPERTGAIIGHRLGLQLGASLGLLSWLQLGIEVPGVAFQSGDALPGIPALAAAGLGDVRLAPKVQLLWAKDAIVDVAIMPSVTLPTSVPGGSFLGEKFFTVAPELLVSREILGVRFASDVGYRARSFVRIAGVTAGHEVFYRAGVGLPLATVGVPVPIDLEASLHGAVGVLPTLLDTTPLEGLVGFRWHTRRLAVTGAVGAGLLPSAGVPDVRSTVSVRYSFDFNDFDDDDVDNEADRCPDAQEDHDGIADGDGCPEDDADGDGIVDFVDRCPEAAEDFDGFEDADGCPDLDDDEDGIADADDACPRQPGVAEWKGCRPPDRDGDRVADHLDRCPDEPARGYADGCLPKIAEVVAPVELQGRFPFAVDQAWLLPEADALLAHIASTLQEHPELLMVSIEGHTDDTGYAAYNKKLSLRRAEAVRDGLIARGVERSRLSVAGYGAGRPVVDGTSAAARAENRRVEIVVLKRSDGADPQTPPSSTSSTPPSAASSSPASTSKPVVPPSPTSPALPGVNP